MKAYFTQLFDYDRFANILILETILTAHEPQKPVQLMAHLLAAQQVWLSRCKGEPAIGGALWPDWPSDQLEQMINDNHRAWINYLNTLNEDDFDKLISYKTFKGMPFENKLVDVLAHVINHGTHHRAQAGQQLKFAGVEKLPITDYIFYIRD
jgi:uncharacterized damage-inducible protein DinB